MSKVTKNEPLQKCKACNKDISKCASKCPHCGQPSTEVMLFKAGISLIFLGLVGIPVLAIGIIVIVVIIASVF